MSMDSVTGAQFLSNASQCSSPRLDADQISVKSEDESSTGTSKVKLMCSYGGRIMLRPHDSQLRYIGGDTRIMVVPRTVSYGDLYTKLSKLCGGRPVIPKYKLPDEDFDALVSVICDEDMETMMEEYDRLNARESPSKLRLFMFPKTPVSSVPFEKSEQAFLEVLNGGTAQQQDVVPDFLFGLDQQEVIVDAPPGASAASSSSSIQKMIVEADCALQSELAPICTSKSDPATAYYQAAQLPVYYQQGQVQVQVQASPQVYQTALPVPSQNGPQQTLPPKLPKPRSSAGSPRAGSEGAPKEKEKKNKPEAVKPVKASPDPVVSTDTPPAAFVVEGIDNVKVADVTRKPDAFDEHEDQQYSSLENPCPVTTTEMSLNVFMEQQKMKEQQRQDKRTLESLTKPEQINGADQHTVMQQQASQVRYQPYIIDNNNNMVYFLADQPVQYIQRPVHVNQQPMQIQRGGSAPSMVQVAPVPAPAPSPVLTKQFSAAYVDQVQRSRVVYPSRFREVPVPVQVQQFDGVPLTHQPLVRQPYDVDPSVVVASQP